MTSHSLNSAIKFNYAANVLFIARFRVACGHFNSATLVHQNERTMKTTSHMRMFVVVAMMTAIACSEPEVVPTTKTGGSTHSQSQTTEFRTSVTTWTKSGGNTYVGLVSQIPKADYTEMTISVVANGKGIRVDTFLDVTRLEQFKNSNDGYYWATVQNNVLLLNYVGQSPTSLPPFPLDVIIVF